MAATKGPLDERVKTDVRISGRVLRLVTEQSHVLGLSKNALFTLGACLLTAKLVPLLRGVKKRSAMLDRLEDLFRGTIEEARRAA